MKKKKNIKKEIKETNTAEQWMPKKENELVVFWFNKINLFLLILCWCTSVSVFKREENNHDNWKQQQQQLQLHKQAQNSNFTTSMRIIYKSSRPITKQANKNMLSHIFIHALSRTLIESRERERERRGKKLHAIK